MNTCFWNCVSHHFKDSEPTALSTNYFQHAVHTCRSFLHPAWVQAGTWCEIPGKAPSLDFRRLAKRVAGQARRSISAHRAERGNIVWACWQPSGVGVEIGDVKRVGGVTRCDADHVEPAGVETIVQPIAGDTSKEGSMQSWHIDLRWSLCCWSRR